ncbi:MAG TPA: ABC transporter permease [Candidatus Acidoferrales bacterium]|nr:ABC transporter permease [Candidatus Acidoferrales bacterium]
MISKIAWRNILRNKRRSLILTVSIMVGVFALVLTRGFVRGFMEQMLTNQIGADVGYMQVHKAGYQADPSIDNSIRSPRLIRNILDHDSTMVKYSERLRTYGLACSAYNSAGVAIVGIIPNEEMKVTTISQYMVKGRYLNNEPNQIIISTAIAEKLKAGIGDKIVIMASQLDGNVGSEGCRISGIYETSNSGFDQSHVYVTIATMQQMLNVHDMVSEFVINPIRRDQIPSVLSGLRREIQAIPGSSDKFETMSYEEMLPLFVMQLGFYDQIFYIIYGIIAVALIFGIIDVMLMAVLERTHEFGVAMAVGMSNRKIFRMILVEAFFLGIAGTIVGLAIAYFICIDLSRNGWDLSIFAESLRSWGSGSKIFPALETSDFIKAVVIIPLVTVIGAVYPAVKAIRLHPVEAIRSI